MKKIIGKAVAIVERLAKLNYTEPVVVRMGLGAVLNVLVVSGAFTVGTSTAVQAAVLGTLNLVLLVTTRQAVTPTIVADIQHLDAYLKGHQHAQEFAKAGEVLAQAAQAVQNAVPAQEPAQLEHTE